MTDEPKPDDAGKENEDVYGSARTSVSDDLQPPPGYESLQTRLKRLAKKLDLLDLRKKNH